MYAPRDREDEETGLAARAAWLSYVGGYTHEDIAARMHLSRIKVTRLVAKAHQLGLVRVFVEGGSADCLALEDELIRRFGLRFAGVTPTLDRDVLPLIALGNAGARYLHDALRAGDVRIVGVGHGRTLGAVVDALPRVARPGVKFVSLLGSLIRHAIANPFGIIHRLAAQTDGEGYFMPVPFVADSVAAKALFMDQTSLKPVFDLAARADLHLVGIGEIDEDSFMGLSGMITTEEFGRLAEAGAVGEVLGRFVDAQGVPLDIDVNERAIGVDFATLRGKEVVAIAGGPTKADAIKAVLRARLLTGLITDEATAAGIVGSGEARRGRAA